MTDMADTQASLEASLKDVIDDLYGDEAVDATNR